MPQRHYEWVGIEEAVQAMGQMAGIDYLRALLAGEIAPAPVAQTIGWRLTSVAPGRTEITLSAQPFLGHQGGIMHGGVLATLLDSACATAGISMLPAGQTPVTSMLNVAFLRPVAIGAREITAIGTVTKAGRQLLVTEARIVDDAGRIHATAVSTALIVDRNAPA